MSNVIKINYGAVRPQDLEVAWETDQDGNVYTWVQADEINAMCLGQIEFEPIRSFSFARTSAARKVVEHAPDVPRGWVVVARVNISGSPTSFFASVLGPVHEIADSLGG